VSWKDFAAVEADIARAKAAMTKAGVEDYFMTSPSPGQIARYLKNAHYKTVEEYLFALSDVMCREYRAIVAAGFILQLDCPDLAMSYALYPGIGIADYRKIISLNVQALIALQDNQARRFLERRTSEFARATSASGDGVKTELCCVRSVPTGQAASPELPFSKTTTACAALLDHLAFERDRQPGPPN